MKMVLRSFMFFEKSSLKASLVEEGRKEPTKMPRIIEAMMNAVSLLPLLIKRV
jgi:hypothetical protein